MTEIKYTNFWSILKNIGIEIPAIQRDYAQGRQVGRIPIIRKKFIHTLLSSLETGNQRRLDFIYGKIYGEKNIEELRKNKNSIKSLLDSIRAYADSVDLIISDNSILEKSNDKGETVFLIPLDGQQRLTALFLIHWYVISKLEISKNLEILKKFRYKTRKSTELFLEMLCEPEISLNFKGSLQEEITNHERFSNTWLDDPTVKSMLVVLDEIQSYFQDNGSKITKIDYVGIWNNLTEKEVINFDFLNLQNFNLSDDLYVKMNARGKRLSDFENFKAWLIGKIENNNWLDKTLWSEYSQKLDVQWNDLFWNHKSHNIFEIDTAYFNYFKINYLIDLISNANLSSSTFKDEETKETIEYITKNLPDFDFESIYDESDFQINLQRYLELLNYCADHKLISRKNSSKIDDLNKFLFNNTTEIRWTDLIKNYILISFIETNMNDGINELNFESYIRVLSNLYNNQTFDSADHYQKAINSIKNINKYLKTNNCTVYEWLTKLDLETFNTVFTNEQMKEEKHKSSLLYQNSRDNIDLEWLALFEEAESHEYFKSKIEFLLTLSNDDKNLFKKYFDKISPLFKSEILNNKDYLLQRALLTFGNYFGNKGGEKVSFFKNDNTTYRSRRENWFSFFTDNSQNILLKSLIDDDLYDENDVLRSLNKIIKRFKERNPESKLITNELRNIDYYKLYIYCAELFEFGQSNLIQLSHKKYPYQLNASNTGGNFKDVLLEFIKFNYFAKIDEVKTNKVLGWVNSPSLEIHNIRIKLVPSKDIFITEDIENSIESSQFNTLKELIEFIESRIIRTND